MTYEQKIVLVEESTPRPLIKQQFTEFFACCSCKKEDINYYMIHNYLWNSVIQPKERFLCFDCVETRLGRKLIPSDFTNVIINYKLKA